MFKSDKEKQIETLAKQYRQKDKRLSWESCLKKAKQAQRRFNSN
ncbi:hypothetical protein [Vibrio sp. SCSIO 43140]|nr:hypothetical protein [Vibrio sp. SCSIO 43140]